MPAIRPGFRLRPGANGVRAFAPAAAANDRLAALPPIRDNPGKLITGMAHGIPLDPGTGEGESGAAGAHMLDVGLSSTDRIAAFFGIAPEVTERAERETRPAGVRQPEPAHGVQAVIENALKAAGLMR